MSNTDEIRWRQRLENFQKAMSQLRLACGKKDYSDLERAGLIQVFGFSFELAWKTLKDLLFYEGHDVKSPRDVIRKSFDVEYLADNDVEVLLDALDKRNLLSHTYREEKAREAVRLIKELYAPALTNIQSVLEKRQNG